MYILRSVMHSIRLRFLCLQVIYFGCILSHHQTFAKNDGTDNLKLH